MKIITRQEMLNIAELPVRDPESELSWRMLRTSGSTLNILVMGCGAAVADNIQRTTMSAIRGLNLYTASDADLDALIFEDTCGQITRKGASNSKITVSLTRTGIPGGIINQGDKVAVGSIEYYFPQDVPFATNQLGPIEVEIESMKAGSASKIKANSTWSWVNNPFDTTITVTNTQESSGGDDLETDESLVKRRTTWWQSRHKGTVKAIESQAVAVPGVSSATVFEDFPVALSVSDRSGFASTGLVNTVKYSLNDVRCAGIPLSINNVTALYISIKINPYYQDGFSIQSVQAKARQILLSSINSYSPGQILRVSEIVQILKGVDGLLLHDKSIEAPGGDIKPQAEQTIRINIEDIQFGAT